MRGAKGTWVPPSRGAGRTQQAPAGPVRLVAGPARGEGVGDMGWGLGQGPHPCHPTMPAPHHPTVPALGGGGCGSSPGINTPPLRHMGTWHIDFGKGLGCGGLPVCTPSAPSLWEQSSTPKAGARHVMRAGCSLHPPTHPPNISAESGGHPHSPSRCPWHPGEGDKAGRGSPRSCPAAQGVNQQRPGQMPGRAVRRLWGAEVLHSLSPGQG